MTDPSDFNPRDDGTSPSDAERADELASAFVDGEATADEIILIENDPTSAERIAQFNTVTSAVSAPITPPPAAIRAAHLAAAMAEFEENKSIDLTTSASPATAGSSAEPASNKPAEPVIDLTAARESRAASPAKAERSNRWLMSAAAALLVVGGIGFASSRLGGSDDADIAADFAGADDAGDEETSASNAEGATEALQAEAMGESDDEAMEDDAMEEESAMEESAGSGAMEDEEAMEEGEESADVAAADADTEESSDPNRSSVFVEAPLVAAFEATTINELFEQATLLEPLPLEESLCAADLAIVDGYWVPVESIDGEIGELIVQISPDGEAIPILVDAACTVIAE